MSDYIKMFEQFGVEFSGEVENQRIGRCPFSGKENKFYVNTETGCWDSKTTGKSGNPVTFVRQFYQECLATTSAIDLKLLADDRKLPTWLFSGSIAYNPLNDRYIIPYKDFRGGIINAGHVDKVGKKTVVKTKGLKVAILGMENIYSGSSNQVFICEGEWDYYAMKWLLGRCGLDHIPLGLPGAGIFKDEWIEFFKDKEVFVLMDNDTAGRAGADRIQKAIMLTCVSMKYINWPKDLCEGYDVRDYIMDFCGNLTSFKTKHKACFSTLMKLMHRDTPNSLLEGVNHEQDSVLPENIIIPSHKEVDTMFKKWFQLSKEDISIDVLIGTCFANRLQGDPVWLYMVGSPGSRKTAMLISLNTSRFIETISTLTPAALVSGMRATGTEDPSLIPKLNNKILVIKDVTTILSGPCFVRDEIFGMLRDAYDGYIEKVFGNGLKKSFKSKFGIIGAVTPVIDGYQSAQSILGERFLKLRLEPGIQITSEYDIIERTLGNIQVEDQMNRELQDIVKRVLEKKIPEERLDFERPEYKERMIYMGMFVAKMRGSINMNIYTREQLSKPIQEIGTRITKQLTKLGMGIAVFRDHNSIGGYELELCKRVAVDTCPDRVEMIVRFLWFQKKPVFTQELIQFTMLSSGTISSLLASLTSLKIIKRVAGSERSRSCYELDSSTIELITKSKIYDGINSADNIPVARDLQVRIRTKVNQRPIEPESGRTSFMQKLKMKQDQSVGKTIEAETDPVQQELE